MTSNPIEKHRISSSLSKFSFKVVNDRRVTGKINVKVRLYKSPLFSNKSCDVLLSSKSFTVLENKPKALVDLKSLKNSYPDDFIEPVESLKIPSSQEYFKHRNNEDYDLIDTLPVLPKRYSFEPQKKVIKNYKIRKSITNKPKTNKAIGIYKIQ